MIDINADILPVSLQNYQGSYLQEYFYITIWDKVLKNEPSKICGRQSLKNLKEYGLL